MLHQRLDPRRILKPDSAALSQIASDQLHQRLDPRRILKPVAVRQPAVVGQWLHQRLDPRRILKRRPGWQATTTPSGLHQRLDPRRILKLETIQVSGVYSEVTPEARSAEDTETGAPGGDQPAGPRLHQRLDPRRILKRDRQVGAVPIPRGYTRGSIRGGY